MNIDFQHISGQKSELSHAASGPDMARRQAPSLYGAERVAGMGYNLDLDKSGFTDNAYNTPFRNMDDIARMAEDTDVFLQHNYMAVLSNTVSDKDYGKAMEDGFDIKDMDAKESVTILDKIKSEMLRAGVAIEGYNDDISSDKLARITGSVTLANELKKSFDENDIPITTDNVRAAKTAVEQIKDIGALDDGAVKFMVQNNMEPTLENIYFASHSTNGINSTGRGFYSQEMGGYYAQKAEGADFDQLKPQIDRVIEEAGLDTEDAAAQDNARWIVTEGIPLTADNLLKVAELRSISFPVNEKIAAGAAAAAIADGKKPIEGNVSDPRSNLKKAQDIAETVKNIDDRQLRNAVLSGRELTIKNIAQASHGPDGDMGEMTAAGREIPAADENAAEMAQGGDRRLVEARLRLEEVRLHMSVDANKYLLDRGLAIDTAPMEKLIESLKNALKQIGSEVSGRIVDEATDVNPLNSGTVFSMTMSRVSIIREAPADIVGEMAEDLGSASLMEVSRRSEAMTIRFKQAGEGYEKLMTAPRADLGDSIKKAFRNVDDILKDLGEELTDENRRVVRILGYNRMDINEDNIEKVRSWDVRLQTTVSRLKPGAVLDLIRQGRNPLSMTIEQLSDSLDQNSSSDRENKGKDEEKYSRFLYKLEHKGDITSEEKKSFIGIYRLFHTLQAGDYQAIGSLLKTDQKMTLGNLLNATRNQRAARRGLDYTVDESFGGLGSQDFAQTLRIDEQIEAAFRYYRSQAEIVIDNLEPEKLKEARPGNETLLPDFANDLAAAESDEELDRAYVKEQVRQIRQTASLRSVEPAVDEIKASDIAVTYNNIEAMIAVRRDRRQAGIWDRLRDFREVKDLADNLGEEDYQENYLKILDNVSDKLSRELMNENDSYIDVRSIALLQKQLSVMGQSAKNESFEVPVEIEGEVLSMHVTLKSEKNSASRMDAGVQTLEYGRIGVCLYLENDTVRGMLTTTNGRSQEQAEYLENVKTRLCERLGEKLGDIGVDRENIAVLYNSQSVPARAGSVNTQAMEGETIEKTDTQTLLKMAKAFVEAL